MRRIALFLLLLAALALTMSACAPLVGEAPQESQIYATFYPFYALTALLTEDIEGLRLSCSRRTAVCAITRSRIGISTSFPARISSSPADAGWRASKARCNRSARAAPSWR